MTYQNADDVFVSSVNLDDPRAIDFEAALRLLCDQERQRVERFKFDVHRQRFARGRAWMRSVLGEALCLAPENLVLCAEENGKPYLADNPVFFNLSHSGPLAVLVVSAIPSLGVDVELYNRKVDIDGLSKRLFTPAELRWIDGLEDDQKRKRFFWIWTAKEARMKATGEGFSLPALDIEILHDEHFPVAYKLPKTPRFELRCLKHHFEEAACTIAAGREFTLSPVDSGFRLR